VVYESPYHRLTDEGAHLTLHRSAVEYPDLATIRREYLKLIDAEAPYRHERGLLVDLREARGRNDQGFEETMNGLRGPSMEGFEPLVVLVQSALGKLHVERHMRGDGLRAAVVTDPEEAMRHLRQSG
jgi:hypothetical protein